MNLHENSGVFEDAIRAANDHLGIRTVFVEKDYWITYLLFRLSKSPLIGHFHWISKIRCNDDALMMQLMQL